MPSKTPKQHRAMEAAAHGRSTLGIPQSVGQDFVNADDDGDEAPTMPMRPPTRPAARPTPKKSPAKKKAAKKGAKHFIRRK